VLGVSAAVKLEPQKLATESQEVAKAAQRRAESETQVKKVIDFRKESEYISAQVLLTS
jgi:hypothetical protein